MNSIFLLSFFFRKNYLDLKIYFQTMSVDEVREVEAYPFQTMLSKLKQEMVVRFHNEHI